MSDTGSYLTMECFDVIMTSLVNADVTVYLPGAEDIFDSIVAVNALLVFSPSAYGAGH